MAHFVPSRTTASDIAQEYFNNVFRYHGLQKSIVSDRDSRFTSHFWQALMSLLNIQTKLSTSFHPQTDGQTERTNRTLEQMLRSYVNYRQNDWDLYLTPSEFAYNNAVQQSTQLSPFELNYGQHPLLPTTVLFDTNVPAANDFNTTIRSLVKIAKDNIAKAQDYQAKYANTSRCEMEFSAGDEVLLSAAHIDVAVNVKRPSKKLMTKYLGPYKILEKVGTVSYKLQLPPTMQVHNVFHVSLLRPYKNPTQVDPYHQLQPPPPVIINDREEYEVEEILDKRIYYNHPQYLVKWHGYDLNDATWEPVSNLEHARELLEEFENSLNK
jgi:hypothetical protein